MEINFSESLRTFGEFTFRGTGLNEMLIPDGVKEIPSACFQYVNIEKLHLPNNLKMSETLRL